MDPYLDFTGKVVLITGGSRGLGLAMTKAFAERGADVVIVSRSIESCEEAAAEVRALGRRALPIACHMARWDQIEAMVEQAYAEFGRIDILINNAGMSPVAPSSFETTEKLMDSVIGLNFKGPFRLASIVGPRMVEAGGGNIINVTSYGALRPTPETAPYAGAKAAMNAATAAHAIEYAPNVRVNAILPGSFRTDVAKHWAPDKESKTEAVLRRFGEPDEIVGTALWLAGSGSSFVTGALIRVDGGRPL